MIDLRIKMDAELKPSFQNFNENNNKSDSELKIKITEDQVAKVVPDRIFSLKLHPGLCCHESILNFLFLLKNSYFKQIKF